MTTKALPQYASPDTTAYPDDTEVWVDWEVASIRRFRRKFTLGQLRAALDAVSVGHGGDVSGVLDVLPDAFLSDHETAENDLRNGEAVIMSTDLWMVDPSTF